MTTLAVAEALEEIAEVVEAPRTESPLDAHDRVMRERGYFPERSPSNCYRIAQMAEYRPMGMPQTTET